MTVRGRSPDRQGWNSTHLVDCHRNLRAIRIRFRLSSCADSSRASEEVIILRHHYRPIFAASFVILIAQSVSVIAQQPMNHSGTMDVSDPVAAVDQPSTVSPPGRRFPLQPLRFSAPEPNTPQPVQNPFSVPLFQLSDSTPLTMTWRISE